MAKVVCPSCGYKNPKGQLYCLNCGTVFSDDLAQPSSFVSSTTMPAVDASMEPTTTGEKPLYHHISDSTTSFGMMVVGAVVVAVLIFVGIDMPSVRFGAFGFSVFFFILIVMGGLGFTQTRNQGSLSFYEDRIVNVVKKAPKAYSYSDIKAVSTWNRVINNPGNVNNPSASQNIPMIKITFADKTFDFVDGVLPKKYTGDKGRMRLSDFLKTKIPTNKPSDTPPDQSAKSS